MNKSKFVTSIFKDILDRDEMELLTTILEEKDKEEDVKKSPESSTLDKLLNKKSKKK